LRFTDAFSGLGAQPASFAPGRFDSFGGCSGRSWCANAHQLPNCTDFLIQAGTLGLKAF
jgi:hypothetical protein